MSETALYLIIGFVVVAAVVAAAWYVYDRKRRERLRADYGGEYHETARRLGSPTNAERVLREREKRVRSVELRELSPVERDRFSQEWRAVQEDFVDRPHKALAKADTLIAELLKARGYPVDDELQRHANLRVSHPEVLSEYKAAREIAKRSDDGVADTEDMRQAMLHYRNLFGTLLREEGHRIH